MSSGKVEDTKGERTMVVIRSWWGTARFGTTIAGTSQNDRSGSSFHTFQLQSICNCDKLRITKERIKMCRTGI